MKNRLAFLGFMLGMVLAFPAFSQNWIKGIVTDAQKMPIVGANVYLADTYDGTSTDLDGQFMFQTTEKGVQTLIVTYLGYADYQQTIELKGDTLHLSLTLRENAFELESVVITAGSFEAGGESKREVLKPLDILTTAGATGDISGALNTLPGTQTVGESGRLFVRGGEGYETKTFIDGIQVMNFYSPSAPNTPGRSRFMPYLFSGTSFSTGGYSAEYGQALSSALVLNSKFLSTQNRIDVSLMSVGADIALTHAWESASFSAKAQYTNLDPYMSLISQEIDWINAPTSGEASAAYRQKISSTGILKVFGNFNRSAFTLNQLDIADPSLKTRTKISNKYTYLNAVVQDVIGDDWNLKGGLSYTTNRDNIGLDENNIDQAERGLHAKLVLSKNLSSNTSLKIGTEYFNRQFFQDFNNPLDQITNRYAFTENLGALFLESDIYLTKSLLARVGLRSEYTVLNQTFNVAPRLSLAFKTSEKSQISAAFGRFQQSPQNEWLMVANALQSEKATHYILNYQIIDKNRTFRVELFHKQYQDLVKFDPTQSRTSEGFSNQGSGYARGFDLFWRDNRSLRNADYWVSYSYLDTKREYQDFPQRVTPDFASKHNLSVVYKQFINPIKSQIGLTYTFGSGRPYHDPNQGQFMGRQTPAYHDISANISYLFRQNIIVHLSATNLLGQDHIYGYEFAERPNEQGVYPSRAIRPAAPRFLFLGVFITFSKEDVFNQLPNL